MTTHEVRLPESIERGARGGPGFKTIVFPADSGFEQRDIKWAVAKGRWDISYGLLRFDPNTFDQSISELLAFFYARNGRGFAFRFKDWVDHRIGDPANPTTSNQTIGLGDDTTTVFQVFKRYSSGGFNYDRTIVKLVSMTVHVLLDGVEKTEGVDWTADYNTGLITMAVAPASTGGTGPGGEQVVAVALEFDVRVRFDVDQLDITAETAEAGSIPAIPLVELKGT